MSEEINLREILGIIFKQKWIIVMITVGCMLIASGYSFFVMKPTYETYSIVRMQSAAQENGNPSTAIKEFQESMKSASTLNSMIEKNQLDRKEFTINSIREMFELTVIPDSNIMKITVKGSEPKTISHLANMLAYELGVRVEITDRTKVVVSTQKQLEELNDQIAIAKERLAESQEQLKNTSEKQVTTQALSKNDLLRNIEQEQSNISAKDAAKLQMQSEEINPLYTELQAQISQTSLDLKMQEIQLTNLKNKVDSNMSRINELEVKASSDKLDVNKSIRILDGTNAIFINPSIEPETPVGPKHLLIIAFAAFVGIIMSIMYAFIRHYMREPSRSAINV